MTFSNELKVGVAFVVATIIFIIGVRYFEDIPIFSGTDQYYSVFNNANGLIAGNPVRVNGVKIGSVEEVALDREHSGVRVVFKIDEGVRMPEGTTAQVSGISALGSVFLSIALGNGDTLIEPGERVPAASSMGLGDLMDRAPALVNNVDTLLVNANATLEEAQTLLESPQSDVRRALTSIQGAANSLDRLLRAERANLSSALRGVQEATTSISTFTETNQDSLAAAIQNINQALVRLDRNLASLETTTATLNGIMLKVDRGEGTLGMLVNDPSLYQHMDSTMLTLNGLLLDVKRNPKRYLKDLRLVDVF